jgi:hypothetical protein
VDKIGSQLIQQMKMEQIIAPIIKHSLKLIGKEN